MNTKNKIILLLVIVLLLAIFSQPIKQIIKEPSIIGEVITKVYIVPSFAPVIDDIPDQEVHVGETFYYDVNATDPYNYTLTFHDNTSLFDIGSYSGIISFAPAEEDVGIHDINISVTNGLLWDSDVFTLTIYPEPTYCGDGTCNGDETCETCPEDCGVCPSVPSAAAPSGGARAVETGLEDFISCAERWECTEWSACSSDGLQYRTCSDLNKCGTTKRKPDTIRDCTYIATCFDLIQNCHSLPNGTLSCEEGIDCGGPCPPCLVATCFDGIQNCHSLPNGTLSCEEGIDCGGPCPDCEEEAKPPRVEKPTIVEKLRKKFPWLLLLIILLLLSMTYSGDKIYVKHLRKNNIEEYRLVMKKYKPIRVIIYKTVITISVILFFVSLYVFWFSDCIECMKKYSGVLTIVIIIALIVTFRLVKYYQYNEYRNKKKKERLRLTHKQETKKLVDLQDELMQSIESKLRKKIYTLTINKEFEKYKGLYREISEFYSMITNLTKLRKEKLESYKSIDNKILRIIRAMTENEIFKKLVKDYFEFKYLFENINELLKPFSEQNYFALEDFINTIKEISRPHMLLVIRSDTDYVNVYNKLVDVYDYFEENIKYQEKIEKELIDDEGEFCNKIEKISSNKEFIDKIKLKSSFVLVYNTLIDLYNQYKKKQYIINKKKMLMRQKNLNT